MRESDVSILIRTFVDGEISSDDLARLDRLRAEDPSIAIDIEVERRLRERVGKIMAPVDVPADLASRISSAIAAASSGAPGEADVETAETSVVGRIESEPRAPRRANLLAIAATIAIVAGAVLFGIFGPQIDRLGTAPDRSEAVVDAALFMSGEHVRCSLDAQAMLMKAAIKDRGNAGQFFIDHLGSRVDVFDLDDLGFEFVGAGPCRVPTAERSAHMIFSRKSNPPELASVFMVADDGRYDADIPGGMTEGTWYRSGGSDGQVILRTAEGGLVYFLVTDEAWLDAVAGSISRQLAREG